MGAAASTMGATSPNTTMDRRTELSSATGLGAERGASDSSGRLGQTGRKRSNPTRARTRSDSQSSTFVAKEFRAANGSKS
jgi:hypothetical protein